MKTFYRYHPTVGAYLDKITFDDEAAAASAEPVSDVEPSPNTRPRIPPVIDPVVPFSTSIAPPKTKAGEVAFFDGGGWVVKQLRADAKNPTVDTEA